MLRSWHSVAALYTTLDVIEDVCLQVKTATILTSPPLHWVVSRNLLPLTAFDSARCLVQAEDIGKVQLIRRLKCSCFLQFETVSILVSLVLESTGPNVDRFVKALGGRLMGRKQEPGSNI